MHYAFEFAAKSGMDGSYLEFGTYSGATFVQAYRAYRHWLDWCENGRAGNNPSVPADAPQMLRHTMYAFDSFEGLPALGAADLHADYRFVTPGLFSRSEQDFLDVLRGEGVDLDIVRTVPGWFDRVLTPQLRESLAIPPAMVVNVDCDLYSSAVPVFKFVEPLLQQGAVMILDDYLLYRGDPRYGVRRAFNEWLESSGWRSEFYLQYGWAGRVFLLYRQ